MATIAEEINRNLPMLRKDNRFTERQQKAIVEYAKTGNATEAGIRAGYTTGTPDKRKRERAPSARVQASRAIRQFRLTYAIAPPIPANQVTEDQVRANLAKIRDEARAAGQFGPAIRAEELVARSVGLLQDKPSLSGDGIEIVIRRRKPDIIDVTPAPLDAETAADSGS